MFAGIFSRSEVVMKDLLIAGATHDTTNTEGLNAFQLSRAEGVNNLKAAMGKRTKSASL
jgi:hypothetical protein